MSYKENVGTFVLPCEALNKATKRAGVSHGVRANAPNRHKADVKLDRGEAGCSPAQSTGEHCAPCVS